MINKIQMSKMSVRRVRGSFRGSLRRYGSAESSRKTVRHHNWIYRNGEWRIAFGKESILLYLKELSFPKAKTSHLTNILTN